MGPALVKRWGFDGEDGIGLKSSVGSRQLNSSVPCICSSWAGESFFNSSSVGRQLVFCNCSYFIPLIGKMTFPFPKVAVPVWFWSQLLKLPMDFSGWQDAASARPPSPTTQKTSRARWTTFGALNPWNFLHRRFFSEKKRKKGSKKLANIVSKCLKSTVDLNNNSISEILAIHS